MEDPKVLLYAGIGFVVVGAILIGVFVYLNNQPAVEANAENGEQVTSGENSAESA